MKKKILIIGNGLNAYSLAKKMSEKHDVYVTPSSDPMKEFAKTLDIREDSINELLKFVVNNHIDMTIPVSQIAINADIAGIFSQNEQPVFAPNAIANSIVSDKSQAKKILYKLHINTPKFGIFEKDSAAIDYLKNQKIPFVLKTNSPKSAVVITSYQVAKNVVNFSFIEKNSKLIAEDYVYGTPFSFYAITDGYKALPIGNSLKYRYSLDGDGGQLTTGMGACAPNYKLTLDDEYYLMDDVIYPVLKYLENGGNPFLGIISVEGIKSSDGRISILGCNSFLQDDDTDAILANLDEDIYSMFESCIIGSFSDEWDIIRQKEQYSVSLVINSKQEKNILNSENILNGIENLDENTIVSLSPSLIKNKYLEYTIPSKGSVMVLTTTAPTVSTASKRIYAEVNCIEFSGIYYRKDICSENILA